MPKRTDKETTASHEVEDFIAVPGRFAYDGLQRVFHEKARLGIMTSLLTHPQGLAFSDLKDLCSLSDGNLNRHLEVLREANFVEVEKTGSGRGGRTTCSVTSLGRKSFHQYLGELERVLQDAALRNSSLEPKSKKSLGYGLT